MEDTFELLDHYITLVAKEFRRRQEEMIFGILMEDASLLSASAARGAAAGNDYGGSRQEPTTATGFEGELMFSPRIISAPITVKHWASPFIEIPRKDIRTPKEVAAEFIAAGIQKYDELTYTSGPDISLEIDNGRVVSAAFVADENSLTPMGVIGPIKSDLPVSAISITKDEIKFNGAPITDVISYDEGTGEVHYYERHWSSGDLIIDGTDPTGYRTIRDKGKVEVVNKHVDPPSTTGTSGSGGCGDAGWYPYASPCFSETVNSEVSFEYAGRHSMAYQDRAGNPKVSVATVINKLKVDGQDLGDYWTVVDAKEDKGSLIICFVKLLASPTKLSYLFVDPSYLDSMNLRHKAYEVIGYPHIYKVVRIPGAQIIHPGCSYDTNNWKSGEVVQLLPLSGSPLNQPTLEVMKQLC